MAIVSYIILSVEICAHVYVLNEMEKMTQHSEIYNTCMDTLYGIHTLYENIRRNNIKT